MPHLVQHNAKGPVELKPQKQSVWVCQCGLSRSQPLCDGSHTKTKDEKQSKVYEYDKKLNQKTTRRKPSRWSEFKLAVKRKTS